MKSFDKEKKKAVSSRSVIQALMTMAGVATLPFDSMASDTSTGSSISSAFVGVLHHSR